MCIIRTVYIHTLIDAKYVNHPSRHSSSELMNCRKRNELRNLTTFINGILQKVKTIN